jgi:succinoglycan biosynthesis transport protein ExoP
LIQNAKDKNELSTSIAELRFDTSAIGSQVEVLKSEKVARGVVAAMKLADDPSFMLEGKSPFERAYSDLRSLLNFDGWFVTREPSNGEREREVAGYLDANLEVIRVPGTYVLAVYYTSPKPGQAAAIADGFAEAYLADQLDSKYDATRRAAGWLETRIAELKKKSIDSDLAIQAFKAQHGLIVTGSDRQNELISDRQLTEMNGQLMAARADTLNAEARYAQIQGLLNSGRVGATVPDSFGNPIINDLREKFIATSKLLAQYEGKLDPENLQIMTWKKNLTEYERLINEELKRISESYRSQVEVARVKEQSLSEAMAKLVGSNAETNQTLVQLRELEREADAYRTLYQTFMQRYQEAVQQQSFPITEARVINRAWTPGAPSYPKKGIILPLSLLVGAMFGAGLGVLREYRDRAFRVGPQVRDELGLEFLGMLPLVDHSKRLKVKEGDASDELKVVRRTDDLQGYSIDHPLSTFAEALRKAKISVDLSLADRRPKIIGVTSVSPGEGKSTVAKNFATLLAHLGARTVLIDADLRNPGLSRGIARGAQAGLVEAIREGRAVTDLLLAERDSGLFVLPAVIKKSVLHTSEVISSAGMRSVLTQVSEVADYVILDLAPLGPVVDTYAVAPLMDGFLLVVEWGRTPREMVRHLLNSHEKIYEKCIGVLLNKANLKKVDLYEHYGPRHYHYNQYSKYSSQN